MQRSYPEADHGRCPSRSLGCYNKDNCGIQSHSISLTCAYSIFRRVSYFVKPLEDLLNYICKFKMHPFCVSVWLPRNGFSLV